jgi:hypothetical protein
MSRIAPISIPFLGCYICLCCRRAPPQITHASVSNRL